MRHNHTRSLQHSDDAAQEEGVRIPSVLQAQGMTREQARQHVVSITRASSKMEHCNAANAHADLWHCFPAL